MNEQGKIEVLNSKEREECCTCGIHYFKGQDPLDIVYCPECKELMLNGSSFRKGEG